MTFARKLPDRRANISWHSSLIEYGVLGTALIDRLPPSLDCWQVISITYRQFAPLRTALSEHGKGMLRQRDLTIVACRVSMSKYLAKQARPGAAALLSIGFCKAPANQNRLIYLYSPLCKQTENTRGYWN